MLAIKNNLMAESAARHLGRSYDALAKSVERLSSGLRINSSKDDAAGLAVRELMRADIAVIKQGSRNAMDAISMLQTMEGAMGSIDAVLIRMKELAEQAATGSYSEQQRNIMNNEFEQMMAEIERIATTTNFNSINMLDNSGSSNIHFGVNSFIEVNSVDVRPAKLFDIADSAKISIAGADGTKAQAALTLVTEAIQRKDSARASFGYMMNRLESTNEVLNIQAENLMAAESRISDVDVATEMAALTRNQVLAQAGVAMLAQANTMPQMALTLLQR
ncbi:MAG TPA: flagellin [Anaerohalosphaeraceae bacterium]|nr:flagellin [Anaerohalosphaeraceae bacterium]HQG05790.1 flagellin [Anaerohalosphaeraceae bacterium]HQI06637.1 flagellin [Anaerohalosphaeraceae bacterium]HQJ67485.1 flagellin [Anaerohalosphaeraceae bacterium]